MITENSQFQRMQWMHEVMKQRKLCYEDYQWKFEKGVRTFQRDIHNLKDQWGAPIIREDDKYFYIEKTFELPGRFLNEKELAKLYSALGLINKYKNTPIFDTLSTIVSKLENEKGQRPKIDGYKISLLQKKETGINWETFEKIADAITSHITVKIDYHSINSGDRTLRKVDPYQLYTYEDELYLAAFCHSRNSVRDFNLNRIFDVESTNSKYEKNFNLEDYLGEKHWGIVKGYEIETVRLKILKADVMKVIEDFPSRFSKIAEDKIWEEYEINTTITDEFVNWLISYRNAVKVVAPDTLKQKIVSICEEIVKSYMSDT